MALFTFFKLYNWYQFAQSITYYTCNVTESFTPSWVFFKVLNCINGTRSRQASHMTLILKMVSNFKCFFIFEILSVQILAVWCGPFLPFLALFLKNRTHALSRIGSDYFFLDFRNVWSLVSAWSFMERWKML